MRFYEGKGVKEKRFTLLHPRTLVDMSMLFLIWRRIVNASIITEELNVGLEFP